MNRKVKKKGMSTPLLVGLNIVAIVVVIAALLSFAHISLRWVTRSTQRVEVPNFNGLSLSEAQALAKKCDLKLFINDSIYMTDIAKGVVLDQQPSSGVEVKPDRTIYIVINAFGDRLVKMPYVAGLSLRQAINTLQASTFTIDRLVYKQDLATNYILSQSYQGREVNFDSDMLAKAGGAVTLSVGVDRLKEQYVQVPLLEGLTLARAKSLLWESGLNVGNVSYGDGVDKRDQVKAVVVRQSIVYGERASWGATINLTLGL